MLGLSRKVHFIVIDNETALRAESVVPVSGLVNLLNDLKVILNTSFTQELERLFLGGYFVNFQNFRALLTFDINIVFMKKDDSLFCYVELKKLANSGTDPSKYIPEPLIRSNQSYFGNCLHIFHALICDEIKRRQGTIDKYECLMPCSHLFADKRLRGYTKESIEDGFNNYLIRLKQEALLLTDLSARPTFGF